VNDGIAVEKIHGGDEAILEFLLGGDANVAQDGTSEFGEEALDEIEPGAVLWREGEFEAAGGPVGEPSKLTVPWRLYSCSRAKVAWAPGSGGKSGAVVAIAWIPGFSS
jgi:hypothetical protein